MAYVLKNNVTDLYMGDNCTVGCLDGALLISTYSLAARLRRNCAQPDEWSIVTVAIKK